MEEVTFNESKHMSGLLQKIQNNQDMETTMEDLQECLDSLDRMNMLVQMGGLPVLMAPLFDPLRKQA